MLKISLKNLIFEIVLNFGSLIRTNS